MGFQVRLLDLQRYRDLSAELDAARGGERIEALVERCLAALDAPEFRRWNGSPAWRWRIDRWVTNLEHAVRRSPSDAVEVIAAPAVAIECMPMFQFSVHGVGEISPNLVPLGDDDAGLYGLIADADTWFDQLFATRFPTEQAPYRVGTSMIVLQRGDVEKLREALSKVVVPSSYPAAASDTLRQLKSLVERALADGRYALAVSEA